ncbi:glyoxalase [Bifidobacterium margollesii]|uniref:Glyoxalase n=1 Tax=Bifidobacterium margollesii TaxID=2020964 RepID=A0A2N5J8M3_9BIFI|nr:VOC family protein [Bifidobacterium margollesii]PLS30531.1 glyoxalase [Bifidobacterium margollesii]
MIDHLTIKVKDFEHETAFYEAALAPLGYAKGDEFPGAAQFASTDGSSVWVVQTDGDVTPMHVAFNGDENAIAAFHAAALSAGGTDNGAPGPRPNYGPTYYAAFVHDPEGNNIEACRH